MWGIRARGITGGGAVRDGTVVESNGRASQWGVTWVLPRKRNARHEFVPAVHLRLLGGHNIWTCPFSIVAQQEGRPAWDTYRSGLRVSTSPGRPVTPFAHGVELKEHGCARVLHGLPPRRLHACRVSTAREEVDLGATVHVAPDSSEVTPDGADNQFIITIPIGTPPREFNIILDSGSGFFWVESSEDCNSQGGGCGSGFASGDLITDTVVLGGSLLNNLTFGLAHVISSEFSGSTTADGLMGLCKAVQTLKNRGFIDAAITSYRLPRAIDDINNGEVTFGWKGLDSELDYTKLDSSTLVTLEAMNDDACF
ncbi:aspartic peptidase domain-containing protein [Mycena leptocephala]|nr:aspartic peptidase domain-containing protein [Mycena leptocephala]